MKIFSTRFYTKVWSTGGALYGVRYGRGTVQKKENEIANATVSKRQ